jgi:hypothetical protein
MQTFLDSVPLAKDKDPGRARRGSTTMSTGHDARAPGLVTARQGFLT